MFSRFRDLNVRCWVHRGQRLGASKIAVCLYNDRDGDGRLILDALDEIAKDAADERRNISFRISPEKDDLRTMRFQMVQPRSDLRAMRITVTGDAVFVEMTASGHAALRDAFQSWSEGAEDFCVSPRSVLANKKDWGELDHDSAELWFWGPTMTP